MKYHTVPFSIRDNRGFGTWQARVGCHIRPLKDLVMRLRPDHLGEHPPSQHPSPPFFLALPLISVCKYTLPPRSVSREMVLRVLRRRGSSAGFMGSRCVA